MNPRLRRLPSLFALSLLALAPLLSISASAAEKSPATLVAGQDYEEISDGKPFQPLNGKIEVVEVFGYTCPHCAHFAPTLEAWKAKQPADVRVTLVPGVFGGYWDAFARAYYAADILGIAERSHQAMFEAIHEKQSMPVQNVAPEELASFYSDYGITPPRFISVLKSEQVEQRLQAAREFAIRSQVQGTPSLVVDGRYLVRGHDYSELLRNAEALIARERAAQAKN